MGKERYQTSYDGDLWNEYSRLLEREHKDHLGYVVEEVRYDSKKNVTTVTFRRK